MNGGDRLGSPAARGLVGRGGATDPQPLDADEGRLGEVGYFDVYPPQDNPGFGFGSRSNYPYFHSGGVAVHGYQGLWLVRPNVPKR